MSIFVCLFGMHLADNKSSGEQKNYLKLLKPRKKETRPTPSCSFFIKSFLYSYFGRLLFHVSSRSSVVYLDPCLGAAHSKQWSKYAFQHLLCKYEGFNLGIFKDLIFKFVKKSFYKLIL